MPSFCAVVNCGSRGMRDRVNFYLIPAILNFKHKPMLNDLSKKRREKWIAALKRKDLTETKLKYARICSKHFISGKPSALKDEDDPDWVPSVNMGYGKKQSSKSLETKVKRSQRKEKRNQMKGIVDDVVMEAPNYVAHDINAETHSGLSDNVHCSSCQTDLDMAELSVLFVEHCSLKENIANLQERILSCESLKDDDTKTKYYTGLPTYKVFMIVVSMIKPFIKMYGRSLAPQEQILLTLVKLRLNSDFTDLAYRFGIHISSVSKYFKNTIHIMFAKFRSLIIWPERDILFKTMPRCFKESFHGNTTVIIDCFEIRCERSSNLLAAAQTWSNYKHFETIKYLIGITPQGTICFISEGWGGRISDKCLTQNSTFLNNLCNGDVVLADRGFLIKEFVELFQAIVKIPAFTRGKNQLHPIDLESTRSIAHVRIHVERVIGLVRKKYRICCGPLPMTLLETKGDEALLDEIVLVCCALVNLCPPIVPL